jgi:predicted DsbA family dithiol-disulfide isomerase
MLVEAWVDVMCPWCYIGKQRLDAALRRYERAGEVRLQWRSYELRPDQQRSPGPTLREVMTRWRGLTDDQVTKLFARIAALGEAEGVQINLDRARPVNSFDAHRLTHLAGAHGLRGEMTERLFRAHLTDNVSVADHDVLVGLAGEVGLDRYAVETLAEARAPGVSAVPTIVVERRYAVAGAAEPDDLLALLREAHTPA